MWFVNASSGWSEEVGKVWSPAHFPCSSLLPGLESENPGILTSPAASSLESLIPHFPCVASVLENEGCGGTYRQEGGQRIMAVL